MYPNQEPLYSLRLHNRVTVCVYIIGCRVVTDHGIKCENQLDIQYSQLKSTEYTAGMLKACML